MRGQITDLAQGLAHSRANSSARLDKEVPPHPRPQHSSFSPSHFPMLTHCLSPSLLVCTPGPDMGKGEKTQKDLSGRLW